MNYVAKKKPDALPEFVILKIQVKFNTTRIDVVNGAGEVKIWKTAKLLGFKHSKKSTPLAAANVVRDACNDAVNRGAKTAAIEVLGIGAGRSAAIKKALESKLKITEIKYVVKLAHNGVRNKKPRRV